MEKQTNGETIDSKITVKLIIKNIYNIIYPLIYIIPCKRDKDLFFGPRTIKTVNTTFLKSKPEVHPN